MMVNFRIVLTIRKWPFFLTENKTIFYPYDKNDLLSVEKYDRVN